MKVLIIGSGGREHALVKQARRSPSVDKVYCAPGNSGIEEDCECVSIPADSLGKMVQFAKTQKIDLTVVGPEQPLTLGIVDEFEKQGLRIFGPNKKASVLEASKIYTKEFCVRYGIPTAPFRTFTDSDEAKRYVQSKNIFPIVIKADGLSAGKGVIICKSMAQADVAIEDMLIHQKFGDSGQKIVIEDFIKGEEASFIFIADGECFLAFPPSQDHKAVFDGDQGPNTGGMGAYAPAPILRDESKKRQVIESIVLPTVKGMIAEGRPYHGFLYAGLMIPKDGKPQLLEYNCRLGDPEAEVILPLLKTDLFLLLRNILDGGISNSVMEFENQSAVCVVLASRGYPESSDKGQVIQGLDKITGDDVFVIHAGTKKQGKHFVTNGGRVLVVTAKDSDLKSAIDKVYKNVAMIHWEGMHYRSDIGKKGLS